jgi:2-haloacid dehalogenase
MAIAPDAIETITIDSYGTIVDPNSATPIVAQYTDYPERFLTHWRMTYLSYVMISNEVEDYRPFDELIGAALEKTINTFHINIDEAGKNEIHASFDDLDVFEDVGSGLSRLSDVYDIYVLSMGTPAMLDTLAEHADIRAFIEDTISVHEIRTFKPAAAVYRHGAARTGTPIERIAHVAGPPFDVRGAMAAGMSGVWIDRGAQPWDPWFPDPDARIDTFDELAAMLVN